MQADLKMLFFLKVKDNFFTEYEVISRIDEFKDMVREGLIDLHTTEGAWSINYNGEELLGLEFWDEICLVIDFLIRKLDLLRQGKTIAEFLPLQTFWLRLTIEAQMIKFELESKTTLRPIHIVRHIPSKVFVQEFVLQYLKMINILALLGSKSFKETQDEWMLNVPPYLKTMVGDMELIKRMTKPTL